MAVLDRPTVSSRGAARVTDVREGDAEGGGSGPVWADLVSYARALARDRTGDAVLVDEIVQNSMVRYLVYAEAGHTIERPFGLMKRIVPQVATNLFTRTRATDPLDDVDRSHQNVGGGAPPPEPESVADLVDLLFDLLSGASLDHVETEVFTRVFVDQQPLEQVARELSVGLDRIAASLHSAEEKVLRSMELSPRQVQLVRLVHFRGLGNVEAAELLGITPNNVGVQLSSARDKMTRWRGGRGGA